MQHRAIETRYKGLRFPSRLTARWAIYLDQLGLKWDFQPEEFELASGEKYLPDFHIGTYAPGAHTYGPWIKIKAVPPTEHDVATLRELCASGTSYGLMLWGQPGEEGWLHIHKEGFVDDDSDQRLVGEHWTQYLYGASQPSKVMLQEAAVAARSAQFGKAKRGGAK